ncbi:MAG: D-tyrosyl-tRNA(Tyr) deacylase [Calditrichaceae bacterium]|nr:D-tyrosyl-tRNA(Tyr) deacylase [Calditrichaceae bacterium]MBN2709931.1 D-tyrosyl-tRNA(Tyr) deacylase [Calditrichaceae bacterium]RQV92681.1 MAG: D-tyrosyl-tRNA(Tyr) deacylase [Calditrichota bacterium]
MKVVLQRVLNASVTIDGEIVGKIGRGICLLIGIAESDQPEDVEIVADKCVNLRIFEDDQGKMNRSLLEVGGEVLAISQFTLLADSRKGRRPSFINAANPRKGNDFYNYFMDRIRSHGIHVESGRFGAMMDVQLTNYGPVTIILEEK